MGNFVLIVLWFIFQGNLIIMQKVRLLLLILFGILSTSTVSSKDLDVANRLDLALTEFFDAECIAGMSVSIHYKGKMIIQKGFGFSQINQQKPIDPKKTQIRIGSISKPITSWLAGRQMETGKLDLDKPIQTYLPDYPVHEQGEITSRLLAGHLAGIRHYRGNEFYYNKQYQSVEEGLEIFKDDALIAPPGVRYRYSSYGWNLFSAVLEAAGNKPFLELMQEEVWTPLLMENTTADDATKQLPNRSEVYECNASGEPRVARRVNNSYKWAGGGFLSSSGDLVKFARAHIDAKLLSKKTIEELWTSQKTNSGELTRNGIGWFIRENQGHRVIRHGGGSVGGSSMLDIYPEQELIIAIAANTSGVDYTPFTDSLANIILRD